jgi:hypothetical protein
MRTAGWLVAFVALLASSALAEDLAFTSNVDTAASCNDVWTNLTEFPRLQKLVPHLHATANVARANQIGDMLFYTIDKADGSKSTGKFVVTSLEPAYKIQVMVQPDEGPWLRVQEFTLYQKPPPKGEKGAKAGCHVDYEEAFNPLALKYKGYDATGIVKGQREPYMAIVLRRLKNLSEGKEPGPANEVKKLADVAKNFP